MRVGQLGLCVQGWWRSLPQGLTAMSKPRTVLVTAARSVGLVAHSKPTMLLLSGGPSALWKPGMVRLSGGLSAQSKPRMVLFTLGRSMGTHGGKEPKERLNSPKRAREFVYRLQPSERACLLGQLQEFQSMAMAQETQEPMPLTSAQIRYILLHNAIPFVGFGFLDNAIMIAAGTQIEVSIGITLGISTMAAAALGNLVSDLAGLGLAGYVEALVSKLGMQGPELTPKQADMWQTRVSAGLGKAIGVSIGCILGMFPLLFISDDEREEPQSDA